jgi:kynureninase
MKVNQNFHNLCQWHPQERPQQTVGYENVSFIHDFTNRKETVITMRQLHSALTLLMQVLKNVPEL